MLLLLVSFNGALGRSDTMNEACPLLLDVCFRDRFRDGGRGRTLGEGESFPITISPGAPGGVTSFTAGDGLGMGPVTLSSTSNI